MQRDPGEADEGEIQDFSAADDNMEGKKVDLLFLLVCFMTVIFNFLNKLSNPLYGYHQKKGISRIRVCLICSYSLANYDNFCSSYY